MILERHRRLKKNQNTFRPNETMEHNRSKINTLTNEQRRNKSRSNVSSNLGKDNFINLTTGGNTIGYTLERTEESLKSFNIVPEDDKRSTSHFELKENPVAEEDYDLSQEREISELNDNFEIKNNVEILNSQYDSGITLTENDMKYKRASDQFSISQNEEEEFYMNAPCQVDINRLRGRVDFPPMTENLVDVTSTSKNMHSNSSKLMKQLQQKKVLKKGSNKIHSQAD